MNDLSSPAVRANKEQEVASDPTKSAFVSASAGSGKTKLLTDRILRLMLGGTAPGRIQCLTFTKAAAAEMALRLQHRLGHWVTLDDDALDEQLAALQMGRNAAHRTLARSLFAQVLDLPGGMRISTIHAFCQSLLRRFPLEAAISPNFRLVESLDQAATLDRAREGVIAAADPDALAGLAGLASLQDVSRLVLALQAYLNRTEALLALAPVRLDTAVRRQMGAQWPNEAALMAEALAIPDEPAVAEALRQIAAHGTVSAQRYVAPLLEWLARPHAGRLAHWPDWAGALLKGDGEPYQVTRFVAAAMYKLYPTARDVIAHEQGRVCEMDEQRRALAGAEATIAMLGVTLPVLRAYAAAKAYAGQLDYGDLIARTSDLLIDPGAAWVLYKLDGGIDHLLLDEVQDTAPAQWQIAHRLTTEFFAGLGTRGDGPPRTFFAVGDPKQSIYSFQGAEPDEFTRSRAEMAARVGPDQWRDVTLDVSFRSARPVLTLVDAVFAQPIAADGVADDGPLRHLAKRAGAAGRVELWPLVPRPLTDTPDAWTAEDRNRGVIDASARLADALADWIARQLASGAVLESQGRALHAGDFLILVRRRTQFNAALVRALKSRGVPVAGLDQLALLEQLAVMDLLALLDAVLLPQDDLAVACVLTSPLGGVSDDSLLALSTPGNTWRQGSLWDTLRGRAAEQPDWAAAWQFLRTVQARADYTSPHALLTEVLGVLGGRARLLARLGPDAAEPIDELLAAALAYTTTHAPSLQGFLHWVRQSAATVKREPGGGGHQVRVMTAHGAKGLQAPVVILPDTTGLPPEKETLTWVWDNQAGVHLPLWVPRKELYGAALLAHRAAARRAVMREHNRLLYVALTRAEDRLVVCGWSMQGDPKPECWYALVAGAFTALGAAAEPAGLPWDGDRLVLETAQTDRVEPVHAPSAAVGMSMPAWAGAPGAWQAGPPPPEPVLPIPLAPSRPDGAQFGPVPRAASPLVGGTAVYRRGRLVHELLQYLPELPSALWADAAAAHLLRHGAEDAEALAAQVLAVLHHPALAPAFAPGSRAEQPLTGLVGNQVVTGVVDRLAVTDSGVWVVDYKTGRVPPADVADTPVRYLRQLAAYRAVLAGVYPGRPVRAVLVWTDQASVVEVPGALLDALDPDA